MITKTGLLNEGLLSIIRAEQSPRIRAYMDYISGRYKWLYHDPYFPMEQDAYGNQFLNTDGHACEGVILWVAGIQRTYWRGVESGEFELNPKRLFRPPHRAQVAPVQSVQKEARVVM